MLFRSQVIGVLSRDALLRAMLTSGPDAYVAGAMTRDFARLAPDADLSEAAPQLAVSGGCALVMEGDKLLGLLTTENLSEFILLRQAGVERGIQQAGKAKA